MRTITAFQPIDLLLVLSAFFFSCVDDRFDYPNPQPEECKLTDVIFFNDGVSSDGSAKQVEYNSQGYVSKVTEVEGIPSEEVSTSNYSYNANNQLIREDYIWDSGRITGYKTYTYHPDGTLAQVVNHEDGKSLSYETYTYDTNKRVTEIVEANDWRSSKRTFEYIGNSENISSVTHYDKNEQVVRTTTYEDYDDKLNPVYAAKGMVTVGESRNNHRKEMSVDADGSEEVIHYTYTYNASGFVTEAIENKEGEAADYKTVFTYHGCD
jgi:hypothetical protein